jgi:hypothetical protein
MCKNDKYAGSGNVTSKMERIPDQAAYYLKRKSLFPNNTLDFASKGHYT